MGTMSNKYSLILIGVLALVLRFWGAFDVTSYVGDEWMYIPSSQNFLDHGHFAPDIWSHPPLYSYILCGSIALLGNNPYGWRLPNVLLGSLSVIALILLGLELFADKRIAFAAGLLLAVEPFAIFLSRTSFMEVPAVFFFLVAVYFIVRYMKGSINALYAAGIFLGFSIALKWYYVAAVAALFLFTAVFRLKHDGPRWLGVAHVFSSLVILPISIYVIAFYPWFQRGYLISEFIGMQADIYRYNQSFILQTFGDSFLRSTPSSPSAWFVKPLLSIDLFNRQGTLGQFFVFMNNPPVWLLTLPALGYALYRIGKNNDRYLILTVLLFISTYLQFVAVNRPIFLYSAITVLPAVHLLVAYFLVSLLSRLKNANYFTVLMTLILCWGLYLYPFVTSRFVPIILYSPFLKGAGN